MMRAFFIIQALISIVTTVAIFFIVGTSEAISFLIGAGVSFTNTLFLTFIGKRIFEKKSVATSFILIIFKYLILGVGLYFFVTSREVRLIWLMVGLSLLVLSVFGLIFIHIYQQRAERDVNGTL